MPGGAVYANTQDGGMPDSLPGDDKAQSFNPIVALTAKLAPNGLPWEQFRRSVNIEDNRSSTGRSVSRSPEEIAKTILEADREAPHDMEASGPASALYKLVTGDLAWVGKNLRDKTVADLVNSVDDYVKSGRLQKEIDDYHNSTEYADRTATAKKLDDVIVADFKKRFEGGLKEMKNKPLKKINK